MLNKFGYINNISYLYGMKEHPLHKGYFCNKDGEVFSNLKGSLKQLKITKLTTKKYGTVAIRGKRVLAHRFIAECWIPNPENKATVNHKNGNAMDNRVENLEWNTPKENIQHSIQTGLAGRDGASNPNATLTNKDVDKIYYLKSLGWRNSAIANEVGVTRTRIGQILKTGWRY
jgi:hypothetical protein